MYVLYPISSYTMPLLSEIFVTHYQFVYASGDTTSTFKTIYTSLVLMTQMTLKDQPAAPSTLTLSIIGKEIY